MPTKQQVNRPWPRTQWPCLRNSVFGYHRTNGETHIARAARRANRHSHDLITAVTSSYPKTQ